MSEEAPHIEGRAYELPLPPEIFKRRDRGRVSVSYGGSVGDDRCGAVWSHEKRTGDTHWCFFKNPEVPKPRTQDEKDSDWLKDALERWKITESEATRGILLEAIRYARPNT